jgi:hypothetical protein
MPQKPVNVLAGITFNFNIILKSQKSGSKYFFAVVF